jgi:hypothetical protein
MSGALLSLLLLAQAAQGPAVPDVPPGAAPDWTTMPDLPWRQPPQITPAMHHYVQAQTRTRHCRLRRTVDGRPAFRVEVAVLVHPEDGVRTTIPRAIGCASVEQYAAGLVTSFARNNLTPRTASGEQWYRATMTFIWAK